MVQARVVARRHNSAPWPGRLNESAWMSMTDRAVGTDILLLKFWEPPLQLMEDVTCEILESVLWQCGKLLPRLVSLGMEILAYG